MFRTTDRTTSEDERRIGLQPGSGLQPVSGLEPVAGLPGEAPMSSAAVDTSGPSEQTVVVEEDRIDGNGAWASRSSRAR